MTLKPKNNRFNEFIFIKLVENRVGLLHNEIGFLFQKLENIQLSKWATGVHLAFCFSRGFSSFLKR